MALVILQLLAWYYIFANLIQWGFVFLSARKLRSYPKFTRNPNKLKFQKDDPEYAYFFSNYHKCPKVSLIIPAYNEALVISESIKTIKRMYYSDLEIIIVNDGSKDSTQEVLNNSLSLVPDIAPIKHQLSENNGQKRFLSSLDPRIIVVEQKNGGKANAVNTGIDHSSGELIVTLDADTIPEEDALIRLIPGFMKDPDLIGASGVIRILDGAKIRNKRISTGALPFHPLALFQVIEYIRAFYLGRVGCDALNATILLSGAFSVFRKNAVIEVGGFDAKSITEDLEIVVRLRRHFKEKKNKDAKFRIMPYPICWTQAPTKLGHLKGQRRRWHQGLLATLWKNLDLLFMPWKNWTTWISLNYLFWFEAVSPIFEILTIGSVFYHQLIEQPDLIHQNAIIKLVIIGYMSSWPFSLIAIHYSESRFQRNKDTKTSLIKTALKVIQFVTSSFVEMFLYHPVLAWWKLQALVRMPFKKLSWGENPRKVMAQVVPVDSSKDSKDTSERPKAA